MDISRIVVEQSDLTASQEEVLLGKIQWALRPAGERLLFIDLSAVTELSDYQAAFLTGSVYIHPASRPKEKHVVFLGVSDGVLPTMKLVADKRRNIFMYVSSDGLQTYLPSRLESVRETLDYFSTGPATVDDIMAATRQSRRAAASCRDRLAEAGVIAAVGFARHPHGPGRPMTTYETINRFVQNAGI
jgi:hypothetical protein